MIHIWKSTYKESVGAFFAHTLKNEHEINVFNMLWVSFRLKYITQSSFFESIRVGDGKYDLWVCKGKDEILTVQFTTL